MNRLINELAGELRSIIAEVNGKYDTAEASHETALRIEDEIRKRINDRIQDVITANALDITPKKMFILVCRRLQGIPFDENHTDCGECILAATCLPLMSFVTLLCKSQSHRTHQAHCLRKTHAASPARAVPLPDAPALLSAPVHRAVTV